MHELSQMAMDRHVKFWKRELSEEILVNFIRAPDTDVKISINKSEKCSVPEFEAVDPDGLFLDFEKMLSERKKVLAGSTLSEQIEDDRVAIPVSSWLDVDFGCGVFGAMFGGELKVKCLKDRAGVIAFYSDTEPVIRSWDDFDELEFNEDNYWVKKVISYLEYASDYLSTDVALGLMHTFEGGNFVVTLRGATKALFDYYDHPREVRQAYELAYQYSSRFFEMRRDTILQHNLKTYNNDAYAKLVDNQFLPSLDTDIYAYAGPKIFEEFGFEYKQKMLNRFKGGTLWIHTLGLHLVPVAGKLDNMTHMIFCNDPGHPRAFDQRVAIRQNTYDIPLHLSACNLDEFLKGLEEKTLPGGSSYEVYVPHDADISRLNEIMKKVRKYRAGKLSGKAKC